MKNAELNLTSMDLMFETINRVEESIKQPALKDVATYESTNKIITITLTHTLRNLQVIIPKINTFLRTMNSAIYTRHLPIQMQTVHHKKNTPRINTSIVHITTQMDILQKNADHHSLTLLHHRITMIQNLISINIQMVTKKQASIIITIMTITADSIK